MTAVSITFRCGSCGRHWMKHFPGPTPAVASCPECGGVGQPIGDVGVVALKDLPREPEPKQKRKGGVRR